VSMSNHNRCACAIGVVVGGVFTLQRSFRVSLSFFFNLS